MRLRRASASWVAPEPECGFVVRCVDPPTHVPDIPGWRLAQGNAEPRATPPGSEERSDIDERFQKSQVEAILELTRRELPIGPSIQAGMELADAIAMQTRGVIIDPLSQRLVLPGEWQVEARMYAIDPREHVTVHYVEESTGLWVHTHGLAKFGRPELELFDLPTDAGKLAWACVMDVSGYVIDGPVVAPGNTLGNPKVPLKALEGSREADHWDERSVLELRGAGGPTIEAVRASLGLT